MLDERLTTALHVEALRHAGVHAEHAPHVLFQASTIAALLDGAYEGDVTFAELREHGDLGLGTLNRLDGEMTAVEGRFYRADVDGRVGEIDPAARTPFAVVVPFAPALELAVGPAADVAVALERARPAGAAACAVRVDGVFERLSVRSVPRQDPPYRPLSEVVAEQRVRELAVAEGTLVGFCFPDYALGLEVCGWHLHFLDAAREHGGHLLAGAVRSGRALIDPASEWRIELPPGIELDPRHVDAAALDRIERRTDRGTAR
jgi:acetolactate decarboxylase